MSRLAGLLWRAGKSSSWKGLQLQPPQGEAHPCEPALCAGCNWCCQSAVGPWWDNGSSLCHPGCSWPDSARGCTGSQGSHQSLPSPANLPCSQRRSNSSLAQLDCVSKLASFTWEGKILTKTQSQCSQWEPSQFTVLQPSGSHSVLPSVWLCWEGISDG